MGVGLVGVFIFYTIKRRDTKLINGVKVVFEGWEKLNNQVHLCDNIF